MSNTSASKKRKGHETDKAPPEHGKKSKRLKVLDARKIPAQSSEAALSMTGELDVASFSAARDYEIKALESNLAKSKKELRLRAFQQVPRNMRRRTASHNVKKVPKRIRGKASKEMKKDNTPTVTKNKRAKSVRLRLRFEGMQRTKRKIAAARAKKRMKTPINSQTARKEPLASKAVKTKHNTLAQPPKATSRFRTRQINKTWLPTHLWHAKRAHMTKPEEPLWRMAIPLSPTEKSYRPSHRAAGSRGCMAWDTSYMSTIGAFGLEASLKGLLKSVGFGLLPNGKEAHCWGLKGTKWVAGTRHETGWAQERDGAKRLIAPVMVIWSPPTEISSKIGTNRTTPPRDKLEHQTPISHEKHPTQKPILNQPKRRLFIRVHPSAFLQLWSELAKNSRIQKPSVTLEDLRFEIGSIELTGAGSTECLLGTLRPALSELSETSMSTPAETFRALSGLTNVAAVPRNAIIAFESCDPRLHYPAEPNRKSAGDEIETQMILANMLAQWPLDSGFGQPSIFSHPKRVAAVRSLASQRAINRRKTLTPLGEKPLPRRSDPRIPTMLLATRARSNEAQGSWILLLPWQCVDAIWRCLMYYPISSGGQPRFGGLDESRQIAFEREQAWFPGDFPGTEAGQAFLRTESEVRRKKWERRPPGRRINFEALNLGSGDAQKGELGSPWECDWKFLLGDQTGETEAPKEPIQANVESGVQQLDGSVPKPSFMYHQISPDILGDFMKTGDVGCKGKTRNELLTIKFTLLNGGTPLPCARLYRLPLKSEQPECRQRWLNLDSVSISSTPYSKVVTRRKADTLPTVRKEKLNWRGDFRKHEVYGNERGDLDKLGSLFAAKAPKQAKDDPGSKIKIPRNRNGKPKGGSKELKRHQQEGQTMQCAGGDPQSVNRGLEADPSILRTSRVVLAQSLLKPTGCGNPTPPQLPGQDDLIGFVTSGNYNLAQGRGTGIGSLWIQKLQSAWDNDGLLLARQGPIERQKRLVIVRNVGENTGRLAIWELL